MLEIAAFIHDLGKLAIPSEILEKPGKLTADEWHPDVAKQYSRTTHAQGFRECESGPVLDRLS